MPELERYKMCYNIIANTEKQTRSFEKTTRKVQSKMIRRFPAAIQLSLLVLAWFNSHVIAGLTVDEQLEQLRINYIKMERLVAAKDNRLESLERKVHHQGILEAQIIRLETEVNQMKAQAIEVQQQGSLLPAQQSRSYSNATSLRQGTTKLPKSCADLKIMGHTLSGMFLIKGDKTVETVFCDFTLAATDPNFQTWIGYTDIKSSPVSFHAQRVGLYDAVNTVVPYNLIRLNVGNALNPSTGVFVAPKPGRYYFAFTGLGWANYVKVQLQMKLGSAGWTKIGEAHGAAWNTMALHSTLQLAKGDQIRLVHLLGVIHDADGNNFSDFVGYLLEEDVFGC